MKTCLAVDIGGTKIAVAIVRKGIIEERHQVATPSSKKPHDLTNILRKLLLPLACRADFVAVASTGIINNGVLHALNPQNLGGLNEYPLQKVISDITQLNTLVINDAQAAAWAEFQNVDADICDMAFITVSTGVGAGLIINNQLLTGNKGIAGHAGHILADPNGAMCGCGRRGCVESIASGTAIGNIGKTIFGSKTTGKDVFEHFTRQNTDATAIIMRSAKAIANLIADLKMTNDIQIVTLGGSIGLATGYLDLVQYNLKELPQFYHVDVVHARSAADAGLLGAASWAELAL
jgi:N-acylmannosamine kinase